MGKPSSEEIVEVFGNKLRLRVCGICIKEDKILMIKHHSVGKEGYLWAPPGGGMHLGESAEETLIREFKEETGLEIAIERFLFVNEFLDLPLHAIELFFEVRITGGALVVGQDPEMSDQKQIIAAVDFLGIEALKKENPLKVHGVLRKIQKISDILQKKGYSLLKN